MPTPKKIMEFYNSKEWKLTVKYIKNIRKFLCEECGKKGQEVHHKIKLTLDNFDNDSIRIGENNLQLLCKSCHMQKRAKSDVIRPDLMFDLEGNVIKKYKTPPLKTKY